MIVKLEFQDIFINEQADSENGPCWEVYIGIIGSGVKELYGFLRSEWERWDDFFSFLWVGDLKGESAVAVIPASQLPPLETAIYERPAGGMVK